MFYDTLNDLCKSNGTSVTAVLKELGISTSKGTAWKTGSVPKGDILLKLSNRFNVTTDYLIGRINETGELIKRTPENTVKCLDKIIARLSKSPSTNQTISDQKSDNIAKIIENLLEMTDEASEETLEYIEYLSKKDRYNKSSLENEAKNA